MAPAKRPLIAVIGCGGTISTSAVGPVDYIEYPDTGRKMTVEEVLGGLETLISFAEVLPISYRAVSSSVIGPPEWVELVQVIQLLESRSPEVVGVVILHGTGTLEETAYFLSLALKVKLPVAVVGAQRPPNTASSDSAINILSGLRTVCDPQATECGVLVVLNDEIHEARDVTKTSTYRLSAFKSLEFGPLGIVDADRVTFYRKSTRLHTRATPFRISSDTTIPRVDIAYAYAGADGAAIRAYVAAGAKGIVSAGFAPGSPTPAQQDALEEAARGGVVIVQTSRAGSGRVARRSKLKRSGWIAGDNLTPQKARVLLMLALTVSSDTDAIQAIFDQC